MQRFFQLARRRKSEAIWLLAFAICPFIAGSGLVWLAVENREFIEALAPGEWFMVFLLLSIPIAFSLIANTLAGLMAGYFLGLAGLAGMILSFSIACFLGYFLGRISGSQGFMEDVCNLWPSLRNLVHRFQKRPVSLVFSLRLMPAPPFAVGSLVLAWLNIPLKPVFLGSFAGMLPRMALMVCLGHFASDISRIAESNYSDFRLSASLSFFAGMGFLIFYLRFLRKSV